MQKDVSEEVLSFGKVFSKCLASAYPDNPFFKALNKEMKRENMAITDIERIEGHPGGHSLLLKHPEGHSTLIKANGGIEKNPSYIPWLSFKLHKDYKAYNFKKCLDITIEDLPINANSLIEAMKKWQ